MRGQQVSMAGRRAVETVDLETGEVTEHGGAAVVAYEGGRLARRELVGGLIRPVAPPDEVLRSQEETRDMIARILKPGRDYDKIPGTDRDTMLQPGAERSAAAFGLYAAFDILGQEIDHDRPVSYVKRRWEWHPEHRGKKVWHEEPGQSEGLYRYVVRCRLIHRASGVEVGTGVGSCSTMESKYIDRPRDLENTVLKMAKKRAFVDAVLTTLGLHDQFVQDGEDDDEGQPGPGRRSGETRSRGRGGSGAGGSQLATESQVNYLKGLLKTRDVDPEAAEAARREVDAGISRARASSMIERLKELPERGSSEAGEPEKSPESRHHPSPLDPEDDELPF